MHVVDYLADLCQRIGINFDFDREKKKTRTIPDFCHVTSLSDCHVGHSSPVLSHSPHSFPSHRHSAGNHIPYKNNGAKSRKAKT
jgi:hypothetical protein